MHFKTILKVKSKTKVVKQNTFIAHGITFGYNKSISNTYRAAMLRRNIQLFIVIASSILGLIATDMILPSLPQITYFFDAPANDVKMLLSIYMLGQFTTVLFWGILADHLGRQQTLFLGMLLFLLGSILSIRADSLNILLIARFLQGAGAIVAPVAGWALIQDLFPKDEGARILAWIGTFTAILPLFAPALGGLIDVLYGWQTSLYCIFIYSLILCVVFIALPKLPHARELNAPNLKQRFSIYYQIIRNKTFISYIALFGLLNAGEWCFLTVAPFYYAHQHIPPDTMGLLLMYTAMGFVCGSLLASRLFQFWGIDKTLNLGIHLALISSALLLAGELFQWDEHHVFNALNMGLYIASSALLWGGTTSRALQCFTEYRGSASAIRSLILLCFSFLGTYFGKLMPHTSLLAVGFFLFFTALAALIIFHNKELTTERLSADTAF
jgi:Bcr/CflA subfamily drug resistance transporter